MVTAVAALEGQMRQVQAQLNDWTTCVSSRTTRGQAAIQKLAGEVSADKERIARALQAQSGAAPTGSVAPAGPGRIDVWA